MHSVENSLWKTLWTCHKTDYVMNVFVLLEFSGITFGTSDLEYVQYLRFLLVMLINIRVLLIGK